ncbi:MAG: ATP-binding protein, partial [Thermoplasmata archaeon]
GRWVASLILNEIFQRNQASFTGGSEGDLLDVVAVLEEAQTVLSGRREDGETIYVEWAKEGRKYGLGGIFITQQPGAISPELVSQGDNFFVFHLLSADDLVSLKRANAHFSDDVLSMILNEPIPGNAYVWSAPYQPFVLPVRVENFEEYARSALEAETAALETTSAEEFGQRMPDLQSDLDHIVRDILEKEPVVPVYVDLVADDESLEDRIAVKLWNLKLAVGQALSPEAARVYADELPDGKKVLPDGTLFDALDRLYVEHEVRRQEKTQYLVLSSQSLSVQKPTRTETVQLQSS